MKTITVDLRLEYRAGDNDTNYKMLVMWILSRLNFGKHGMDIIIKGEKFDLMNAEVLAAKEDPDDN